MTIQDSKLAQLDSVSSRDIISLMNEWGYIQAPDPGYRINDEWWAGFMDEKGKANYAWANTAEQAVRQAAIDRIMEDYAHSTGKE